VDKPLKSVPHGQCDRRHYLGSAVSAFVQPPCFLHSYFQKSQGVQCPLPGYPCNCWGKQLMMLILDINQYLLITEVLLCIFTVDIWHLIVSYCLKLHVMWLLQNVSSNNVWKIWNTRLEKVLKGETLGTGGFQSRYFICRTSFLWPNQQQKHQGNTNAISLKINNEQRSTTILIRAAGETVREANTNVVWCKDMRHLNNDPAVDFWQSHYMTFIHREHSSTIGRQTYACNITKKDHSSKWSL